MINILLVDDQALLCEVLKTWLDVEEDLIVAGVAHDGEEAIAKVEELRPDIVLMDIDMPKMNGLSATKIVCQRFPETKIIVLSGHDDDAYLGKSLRAGAKGYLLKNTTAEELVMKIRSVYNNINVLESNAESYAIQPIQMELEELFETYRQKFQNQIQEYQSSITDQDLVQQLDQRLEQRIHELKSKLDSEQTNLVGELEYKNQSSWESIRKELISVNSQFNQANRTLSTQFNQQLNNLKQELDSQLSSALDDWSRQRAALQEWAVQRDEMRPSMEEYESRNRHELMSVVNPIKASFGDVDQKINKVRNWAILSSFIAVCALALSGYLWLGQSKSIDSTNPNINSSNIKKSRVAK